MVMLQHRSVRSRITVRIAAGFSSNTSAGVTSTRCHRPAVNCGVAKCVKTQPTQPMCVRFMRIQACASIARPVARPSVRPKAPPLSTYGEWLHIAMGDASPKGMRQDLPCLLAHRF
jgi:hypothetical protein